MNFLIGNKIRSTVTFRNLVGANADPTTVTCKVRSPSGVETTATTTNPSVGVYYADVTLDASGNWWVRWTGTGALVAATEDCVPVDESEFTTP